MLDKFSFKLKKNLNLKEKSVLGMGLRGEEAGGLGRGWSEHNGQMFQMALLLFKENNCAKLF